MLTLALPRCCSASAVPVTQAALACVQAMTDGVMNGTRCVVSGSGAWAAESCRDTPSCPVHAGVPGQLPAIIYIIILAISNVISVPDVLVIIHCQRKQPSQAEV